MSSVNMNVGSHARTNISRDEPLAKHSSWRTGGCAEYFAEPRSQAELINLIKEFGDKKITWLGLGSNVLIRDGGIKGLVISTVRGLGAITWLDETNMRAECGVPCAKVAKEAAREGCTDAEFFAGIPGTIGGALAMNAGAFGGETWDLVTSAEVVNRHGELTKIEPGDYVTGYRHVGLPADHWFVSADFSFRRIGELNDSDLLGQAKIKSLLAERARTQPTGVASCGSVFKNPPGDHAGRLIEAAGMKGFRLADCAVSDKHANFIVNDDSASASQIEALIKRVQAAVLEQFGVLLEPEVRIIGEEAR